MKKKFNTSLFWNWNLNNWYCFECKDVHQSRMANIFVFLGMPNWIITDLYIVYFKSNERRLANIMVIIICCSIAIHFKLIIYLRNNFLGQSTLRCANFAARLIV